MSFTLLFRQKAQDTDKKILAAAETFRSEAGAFLKDVYIERLHSVTPEYLGRHGRIYRVEARPASLGNPAEAEKLEQSLILLLMAHGLERGFVPMNENGEAVYDPARLGLDITGQDMGDPEDAGGPGGEILSCRDDETNELIFLVAGAASPDAGMAHHAHCAYLRLLRRTARECLAELCSPKEA